MTLKIRVTREGKQELEESLETKDVIIGRSSSCDVVIRSNHISGRHARILSGVILIDLDSTNGTYVGGKRVRHAELITDREFVLGVGDDDIRVTVAEDGEDLGGTVSLLEGSELLQTAMVLTDELEAGDSPCGGNPETGGPDLARACKERDDLARSHKKLLGHLKDMANQFELLESQALAKQREIENLKEELAEARSARSAEALDPVLKRLRELTHTNFFKIKPASEKNPFVNLILELFSTAWFADRVISQMSDGDDSGVTSAPGSKFLVNSLPALFMGALDDPDNRGLSEAIGKHMDLLRGRLAELPEICASASAKLFKELTLGLSEKGLTKNTPIPSFIRLAGQSEAELWNRSRQVLKEKYTADYVESRFLDLVRVELKALSTKA